MLLGVATADRLASSKSPDGVEKWGGSGWVRLGQYLPSLPYRMCTGYPIWKYDHFVVMSDDEVEFTPDVLILQRLMHKGLADHIKQAKANGQIIINDIDDWYWGLSPTNAAWYHSHPKINDRENINYYKSIIAASSYVTVSTPYLLDRVSSFTKCPLILLPNTIDVGNIPVKEHTDDTVPVVGWAGSTAHRSRDIETVANVLRPLYNNNEIKLMHLGHLDDYARFSDVLGLPEDAVTTYPLMAPEDYYQHLTMDVGIVPLNVIPFNQAKSDIKGLEYAAAGIPFVAQSIDSYDVLCKEYGIGRVAKRPDAWIKNLKALKDPHLRRDEGLSNREKVWARDIKHGVTRFIDLLDTL